MALTNFCKHFVAISTTLCLLSSFTIAQDVITLECPLGWTYHGAMCYKLYSVEMEWSDAQKVCESYGAFLVKIFGYKDNKHMSELVQSKGVNKFWIGNLQQCQCGDCMCGELTGAKEGYEGFWSGEEPDMDRDCAYVSMDPQEYYVHAWSKARCNSAMPFLCEGWPVLQGYAPCLNGYFVKPSDICNGQDDCGDDSDERNCPSEEMCRRYLTNTEGTINSKNPYDLNTDCQWSIESPVGTRIMADFQRVDTETTLDEIQVWVGGPTLATCRLLARISGQKSAADLPRLYSNNNFMIIRFTSDSSTSLSGFSMKYLTERVCEYIFLDNMRQTGESYRQLSNQQDVTVCSDACTQDRVCVAINYIKAEGRCDLFTEIMPRFDSVCCAFYVKTCTARDPTPSSQDILPGQGQLLQASEDTVGYIESPMFNSGKVVSALRDTYHLWQPLPRRTITVQVEEMDIPPDAYLVFHDGKSNEAPILALITGDEGPQVVMSTQGNMTVYYHTGDEDSTGNGFRLSYRVGCQAFITADYGEAMSAGYDSEIDYPNYQECTWTISSKTNVPIKMIIIPDFEIDDTLGDDRLEIFEGSDNTGALMASHQGPGMISPSSFMVISGNIFISFKATSINSARGFKAIFSKNCPDPDFHVLSIINPTSYSLELGSRLTVECPAGYIFAQEKHKDKSIVQMECVPGGWNVDSVPRCEPQWCGQPPLVDNAYVKEFDGIYGVVFGESVTYECYSGFGIIGSDTISCQSDGKWPPGPTCQAASCTGQSQPAFGSMEVTSEDSGLEYGSVLLFTCNPGFEISGSPLISCKGDGTWSDIPPTCVRLHCPLPTIENSNPISPAEVLFEGSVTVSCMTGFVLSGSPFMSCLADQSLSEVPACNNIDECGGGRGPCAQNCVDTIGSYICSCDDGYVLTSDILCQDINECDDNNGGCSDTCTNSPPGSYTCDCPAGFKLFTADGTEGYTLGPLEDGSREGDMLYLDHTCVRKRCPDLDPFNNGDILSTKVMFHYEDEVNFFCKLGYVMSGSPNLRCQSNGGWSSDQPTCAPATCSIPSTFGMTFPPTFDPASGPIAYEAEVSLTCTLHRPTPLVRIRQCVYDQPNNVYTLALDDTLECPVIDCEEPDLSIVPASVYQSGFAPSNTKYLAVFLIACSSQSTILEFTGNTEGDQAVVCGVDGQWNFGTFRCLAKKCVDPGTPDRATQVATSYAEGVTVSFTCNDDGFELDDPTPLTCILSGNNPIWDRALPTCIDTEKPTISQAQSLCGSTKEIGKLTAPRNNGGGFDVITARDNTGATENSLNIQVSPPFSPAGVLNADTSVTYTVTDFANNVETCTIDIIIIDDEFPTLTCPQSYVIYLSDRGAQVIDFPQVGHEATATDNEAEEPEISYSPARITVSEANVGDVFRVNVQATDASGNTVVCAYVVSVEAAGCTDWGLKTPRNGIKNCQQNLQNGGWDCTMSCLDGTYPYENPDQAQTVYSCTETGSFSPAALVPDCVVAPSSEYRFGVNTQFTYDGDLDIDNCNQYYLDEIARRLPAAADYFAGLCRTFLSPITNGDLVDVAVLEDPVSLIYTEAGNIVTAAIGFSLYPRNMSSGLLENSCGVIITAGFFGGGVATVASLDTIPANGNCPELTHDQSQTEANEDIIGRACEPGHKKQTIDGEELCLPCPYGYIYNPDVANDNPNFCTPVPLGKYVDVIPATIASDCPPNTYTAQVGSPGQDYCLDSCSSVGMVSSTGLPPCNMCPKGQYATDAFTCTSCGPGKDTVGPGSSQCLDRCGLGMYSDTGLSPCQQCPFHFYQNGIGQNDCIPCPSTSITEQQGSTSSSACIAGAATLCTAGICNNNGQCSVVSRMLKCTCDLGYTGEFCGVLINYCESSPCVAGTCQQNIGGYTCNCPSGFSGDECQNAPDYCINNLCSNGAACQSGTLGYICLCPENFEGVFCTTASPICSPSKCSGLSQGTCVEVDQTRYKCTCRPGFEGRHCEINIDECLSNPCLNFGACIDLPNGFSCDCESGFAGNRCQFRPNVCALNPCQGSGVCFDDYRDSRYTCVCNEHYLADTSYAVTNNLWLQAIATVTVGAQCDRQLYCPASPCERGTCSETSSSGPSCQCPTGYDGSKCQHDVDNCATRPCIYGACIDGLNSYACQCDPGYTGNNCDVQINFCTSSYPCANDGTDSTRGTYSGCNVLQNSYECVCRPGYTGINCEVNIDECASNPCLHDGDCLDGINGFQCDCLDGWNGARCEYIVDNCANDPCRNGADCISIFGNFFCLCVYPFYGQTCSESSNVCTNPNPCKDSQAICNQAENSLAVCDCTTSGRSMDEWCHISIDFCGQEGICQHGGTCISELDDFKCACAGDFYGDRCELSVDDCVGISCPGGGKCRDGQNDHMCECPLAKVGTQCKDLDEDYDIYFKSSDGTASSCLEYPFELGVESFSIGMWLRFEEKGGEGTILTLYGQDNQYRDSPKKEIVRVTETNTYTTFAGEKRSSRFTKYDINDKHWYFYSLQWSGATGAMYVSVNSVRVAVIESGHGEGVTLPSFGMICLGAQMDANMMPKPGTGFNGWIYRVNVWNRMLDFEYEVPGMADDYKELVTPGLILRWKNYLTNFGTYVQHPSKANRAICKNTDFTGPNCDIPAPDSTPPVIEDCPSTVWLQNSERLSQVSWEEPTFKGADGGIRSTLLNARVFIWGSYMNVIVAYDKAGNAAMCCFEIFVRKFDCPEPIPPPHDGSASCTLDTWPNRNCHPTCDANTDFSVPVPDFYTCGPQGSFNVHNPYLNFAYPACSTSSRARVNTYVYLTYMQISACEEVKQVSGFTIPIMLLIKNNLDSEWGEFVGQRDGFCHGEDCEDVVEVTSECGGANTVGRRRRSTADAFVTIALLNTKEVLYNSDGVEQTPEEILLRYILDQNGFDLSGSVPNGIPDETALRIVSSPICVDGQTLSLSGDECIDCAIGEFYDSSTQRCMLCPVGTYQDTPRSMSCKTCGNSKTTELTGTISISLCYDLCNAGSYLNTIFAVCQWCEIGFYQDLAGQFFCHPCPADKTTLESGSSSFSQCIDLCPDGTEQSASGGCSNCPRGTYRTQGATARCTECEAGFITPTDRARTEDECTVPDCQKGSFYDTDADVCSECPIGEYQSRKWQESCELCPDRKTTMEMGSTSVVDCLFFCPMGLEEYPIGQSLCRQCPLGTYKDNSDPDEVCVTCADGGKPGYVTDMIGSISILNCTTLGCLAGQQPNTAETGCEPCPLGTFQPSPYQSACDLCPPQKSTEEEGATSSFECKEYCPDGEFANALGDCTPCLRGTYRNNNDNKFGPCETCTVTFVTAKEGSTSPDECSVRNCTSGYKLNVNVNQCEACPLGYYQDQWWQTSCVVCPPQKTTEATGSESEDDCLLNCDPGYEDRDDVCVECGIGFYKSLPGSTRCTACRDGYITPDIGATSSGACSIGDCQPGEFRDSDNMCYQCDKGTYQEKKWQTECLDCPMGSNGRFMTTAGDGADDEDDCILLCDSGEEYDLELQRCVKCEIGYYRTINFNSFCVLCPSQYITDRTGAIISTECTAANCSAGTYRDKDTETCKPCPLSQFQPNKWELSCVDCPFGMTTLSEGAESISECRRSCPSGQELIEATNQCRPCPQNMYRDIAESFTCIRCPVGSIAPSTGAASSAECTWPDCTEGYYINSNLDCEPCEDGTFQPDKWSRQCLLCPGGSKSSTGGVGATAVTECISTDDCKLNENLCTGLGQVCYDLDGLNQYECRCAGKYVAQNGVSPPCVHKCDTGYCLNNATCDKNAPEDNLCSCPSAWRGERCNEEPPSMTNYIIGGTVGGFVFLILLILLIVFCCVCLRPSAAAAAPMKQGPPMMMPMMNTLPASVVARPAPRYAGSNVGSGIIYQTSPAPQTVFASDTQSLPGYSTMGGAQYMFYEDMDEGVANQQQPVVQYGTTNTAFDPYEEKKSSLPMGGEEMNLVTYSAPITEPDGTAVAQSDGGFMDSASQVMYGEARSNIN